MPSQASFKRSAGTISSQLPLGHPVIRTTPFLRSRKSGKSSKDIVLVDSFSGRSYTLIELCMCTGSFKPLDGQMHLWNTLFGAPFSTASEEVRCVECNLVRPYRITSASM